MTRITKKTTREQLAAIVVAKLRQHKINAVLVGGSVVSIYTNNKYHSIDLDFVASAETARITGAMSELGFEKQGKDYVHPNTEFTVEFPGRIVAIGDDEPVIPQGKITVNGVDIVLLSPTQSIMDRLAAFFHWNDRQSLEQAVMIADSQSDAVSIEQIAEWAKREGYQDKFRVFLNRISAK